MGVNDGMQFRQMALLYINDMLSTMRNKFHRVAIMSNETYESSQCNLHIYSLFCFLLHLGGYQLQHDV